MSRLVAWLFVLASGADAAGPNGSYCGAVPVRGGSAKVNVNVKDTSHVDVTLDVFGAKLDCPAEPYTMNAVGVITLTNIQKDGDCLKTGFAKQGQDPSLVFLQYDAAANGIAISVLGHSPPDVELKLSGCSLPMAAGPSGPYCGAVPVRGGSAKVKVNVKDTSHVDVTLDVFGAKLDCPAEPYTMNAVGVITLTNMQKDGDCLKTAFAKQGQDPSLVSLQYDAAADGIAISVLGHSPPDVELKPSGCKSMGPLIIV